MITYITAFIFYTLAMIGILLIGFVVYKKMMINPTTGNKGMIKILDNYPIAPKKSLMVVKIKDEKFLIASGMEHTTFLAKLEENKEINTASVKDNKINVEKMLSEITKQKTPKDEIKINDIPSKPQKQVDELQYARLQKLQNKFNELYNMQDETKENKLEQISENKKVLNRILQELNLNNSKLESKVNNG